MKNDIRAENIFESVKRYREFHQLLEGTLPFLIYRSDTGVVIARGIYGYEAAVAKANELRKRMNLKWEQVKFKADRSSQMKSYGQSSGIRMDYAKTVNPSKGHRFRGYFKGDEYHDID